MGNILPTKIFNKNKRMKDWAEQDRRKFGAVHHRAHATGIPSKLPLVKTRKFSESPRSTSRRCREEAEVWQVDIQVWPKGI